MTTEQFVSRDDVADRGRQLNDSGCKVYLATTGAAASAARYIWDTPGASQPLMGFEFPYSQYMFDKFVGRSWSTTGKSYCGVDAAHALAQQSFLHAQGGALFTGQPGARCIGVGLSAAVETGRTLRGGTRMFAAVRTPAGLYQVEIHFTQGFLGRDGSGMVCDLVAYNLTLFAAGIPQVPIRATQDELRIESDDVVFTDGGMILDPKLVRPSAVNLSARSVLVRFDGTIGSVLELDRTKHVIIPGSFNPFHGGHDQMGTTAKFITGKEPIFEISKKNVDKLEISVEELDRRLQQFRGRWDVVVTRDASRFVDKAKAYGDCDFVIGEDTAVRIVDPKYYFASDKTQMLLNLEKLRDAGVKFYVLQRPGVSPAWPEDDRIAALVRELFIKLPGQNMASSTMIREAAK